MNKKLATGIVKWFNAQNGYGFVKCEDYTSDIHLHSNVLKSFGRSSVAEQTRVTGWIDPKESKLRFYELVMIEPATFSAPPIMQLDQAVFERLYTLPFHPARVKWFDKAKGYGFATIFGHLTEVFIHLDVLRQSGFADLFSGEAISLRVVDGPRGQIAVQVGSWLQPESQLTREPALHMSARHVS